MGIGPLNEVDTGSWLSAGFDRMVSGHIKRHRPGRFLASNWKAARKIAAPRQR
jgi:hypothetical protein